MAQVRVDVEAGGEVRTSYAEFPEQALPPPLLIRAAQIDYFDVRRRQLLTFLCDLSRHQTFAALFNAHRCLIDWT